MSGQGASQPAIVLVNPQLGENIGKAARAMLNFGLTDMRLVAPRDGWPNDTAKPAASGADAVLEKAELFDDVASAVSDCSHVLATTVRKRGLSKPVLTPAEAAQTIHAEAGKSAILFGPERAGLDASAVALARSIVTIPINPDFGSLNLAQAVIIVAYEWSKQTSLAIPTAIEAETPAKQADLEGLIAQVNSTLEASGYFFPPDRTPATKRTLRAILTKPGWTEKEVRALRGVIGALTQGAHGG